MDESARLPPHQVDALAQRLQSALKRRRPHGWVIVVALLIVATGTLALLAWWLHGRPVPPRLEVVVFDGVVAPGEAPRGVAQLAFPDDGDYPPAMLQGHKLFFLDQRAAAGPQGEVESVVSDATGRGATDRPLPAPGKPEAVTVRYVDARYKQGSTDQARLFLWEPGSKILLVDVAETLAAVAPDQWATMAPVDIPLRPHAAAALQEAQRRKVQVGYLALGPTTALGYRKMRGWVNAIRSEKERCPAGPVLGRPAYPATEGADAARDALLADLTARFGGDITLIAAGPAAAAGVRVITLGAAPPGAANALDWADAVGRLNP